MSEAEIQHSKRVNKFYQDAFRELEKALEISRELNDTLKKQLAEKESIIDDLNAELAARDNR